MSDKFVIDAKKIYNNGLAASVKGIIYELEPKIYELAKDIDNDQEVVIELKFVGKKKQKEKPVVDEEKEDESIHATQEDEEVDIGGDDSDPFEKAANG